MDVGNGQGNLKAAVAELILPSDCLPQNGGDYEDAGKGFVGHNELEKVIWEPSALTLEGIEARKIVDIAGVPLLVVPFETIGGRAGRVALGRGLPWVDTFNDVERHCGL